MLSKTALFWKTMPLAQKMPRYVKPEPQQITIWRRISYLMPQLKSF